MKFPDGFRAQYYLRNLLEGKREIESQLSEFRNVWPEINLQAISNNIFEELAWQIDQIVLPTIVYEIVLAGDLPGATPTGRYRNFFLRKNKWTEEARSVVSKYSFLMEMVEIYVKSFIDNVSRILQRIGKDYQDLINSSIGFDGSCLASIRLGISDRHLNGQQTAILFFSSGNKLIYKPVDLSPNKLFADFVEFLRLEYPFDIYTPEILAKNNYGWVEFVHPSPCREFEELRKYYKRAGVILAIADALNYCDGHMENLIASSGYPILIDYETLFHSFGETDPKLGERSVLFTGLIEKPPESESDKGFTSAFQAPSTNRYELLSPHAVNDRTDNIAVRYRGFTHSRSDNSPVLNNTIQTPLGFISDFAEGFCFGYKGISAKVVEWLNQREWWESLEKVKARQLVRHTLYYELLIRKIQQPEGCKSKEAAFEIIHPLLFSKEERLNSIAEYEVNEILKLDIPFFYHFPGLPHLYDGNGKCYPCYFERAAADEIRDLATFRSDKYLKRNIEIIKNVLKASPEPMVIN